MANLKRNFLVATDKNLMSERARNFRIELSTHTQDGPWQKKSAIRRRVLASVRANRTPTGPIATGFTGSLKKSRGGSVDVNSTTAHSRLVTTNQGRQVTTNQGFRMMRQDLKKMLKLPGTDQPSEVDLTSDYTMEQLG